MQAKTPNKKASRIYRRGSRSPQMNMTPLIDVTFLLIIFFLLVNNIIAEQDIELLVPQVDQPQVIPLDEQGRLTINIVPDFDKTNSQRLASKNPLRVNGNATRIKVGFQEFSIVNLSALTEFLIQAKAARPKLKIVLRADAATEYRYVAPVIESIAAAKFDKVNLMAFLPDQGHETR